MTLSGRPLWDVRAEDPRQTAPVPATGDSKRIEAFLFLRSRRTFVLLVCHNCLDPAADMLYLFVPLDGLVG